MISTTDAKKSFQQNSTSIYNKNSPESGHRGDIPQNNKGHILSGVKHHTQW